MSTKIRNFAAQLSYLPKTLRLIWTASRGWTLAWVTLLIIQGLVPAVTVYLSRLLVDSLAMALGAGIAWENIRPTSFLAALMVGALLLTQILQSVMEWVRTAQSELIRDYLSALIHEKATSVDMAYYESPDYYDRLYQARNDLQNRPLALLENGGGLLQSGITVVAMAAIIISYGLWLPLVLLVSTFPALWVVLHHNRRYHRWWKQSTVARRWAQYYDTMLTVDSVAAELRLFDLGSHFRSAYQQLRRLLRTERLQLVKARGLARLGAGAVATLISGGTMAWMVWQAFLGRVTLGDLVLFYQALSQGQSLLRSLLGNVGQIYENILFLGNLFEFLELEPQVVDPPEPVPVPATLKEGIHFRQVTFRYPGSERVVLQNFDFIIPAGKVVAIVGSNGVGKTTLVKLLCRFYDPEAGCVEIDGIDVRNLSLAELWRMITILFQFPINYLATAGENITLGDLTAAPDPAAIETAARRAGAHEFIARLPRGYDTMLGKWFAEGTDLSGGEWQRLALARAFVRRAQIMILDEPTSLMDSWAEADWFDRFRELANGRTAIVITHRFTTAKRADIIYVMDDGHIVESGSHEELLTRKGLYAQSWKAQMQSSVSQPGLNAGDPDLTQVPSNAFPSADVYAQDRNDGPSER